MFTLSTESAYLNIRNARKSSLQSAIDYARRILAGASFLPTDEIMIFERRNERNRFCGKVAYKADGKTLAFFPVRKRAHHA